MQIVLASLFVSAATTIVITAIMRKKVMDYIDDMCDINLKQVEKVKECAISNIETLIQKINQNRSE